MNLKESKVALSAHVPRGKNSGEEDNNVPLIREFGVRIFIDPDKEKSVKEAEEWVKRTCVLANFMAYEELTLKLSYNSKQFVNKQTINNLLSELANPINLHGFHDKKKLLFQLNDTSGSASKELDLTDAVESSRSAFKPILDINQSVDFHEYEKIPGDKKEAVLRKFLRLFYYETGVRILGQILEQLGKSHTYSMIVNSLNDQSGFVHFLRAGETSDRLKNRSFDESWISRNLKDLVGEVVKQKLTYQHYGYQHGYFLIFKDDGSDLVTNNKPRDEYTDKNIAENKESLSEVIEIVPTSIFDVVDDRPFTDGDNSRLEDFEDLRFIHIKVNPGRRIKTKLIACIHVAEDEEFLDRNKSIYFKVIEPEMLKHGFTIDLFNDALLSPNNYVFSLWEEARLQPSETLLIERTKDIVYSGTIINHFNVGRSILEEIEKKGIKIFEAGVKYKVVTGDPV